MEPFTTITGTMAPLMRANIDTDQIIPTDFLKRVERTGFGRFLFHDWVHDDGGEPDPAFVLNRPEYRNASLLITGPNFGCGSSREHAPWALQDWGFRVVIAQSFADIFRANCHKIGLLPVVLEEREVGRLAELAEMDPDAAVTVDLEAQSVVSAGFNAKFEIDPAAKRALLAGLDEIDMTLQHEPSIAAFEGHRPSHKPVLAGSQSEAGDPHD